MANSFMQASATSVEDRLDLLAQDLRIAMRGLRRSPTFTVTTVRASRPAI